LTDMPKRNICAGIRNFISEVLRTLTRVALAVPVCKDCVTAQFPPCTHQVGDNGGQLLANHVNNPKAFQSLAEI